MNYIIILLLLFVSSLQLMQCNVLTINTNVSHITLEFQNQLIKIPIDSNNPKLIIEDNSTNLSITIIHKYVNEPISGTSTIPFIILVLLLMLCAPIIYYYYCYQDNNKKGGSYRYSLV
jgi:hypothetical protein